MWRARLIARETTDLSVEGRAVRGPADRRHPAQDQPGPGRPAGPGGPALLRPRPRHRRRGGSPRQARRLATPRRRPGHHRHHDDPGHPRRRAPRPDHHPDRRRPQRARRHRGPRCPPRPRGRDPRRPPARPRPALRPRGAAPSQGARAGATNLYVHLTPADLAADLAEGTGAASIEKLGAATTQLLTDWLTGSQQPAPRSPSARSSTSTPTGPSTSTTHPTPMRETVMLRDAHCVFPGCRRDSRPATSTTSPNTYPSRTADHPARPSPAISHLCAEPTTA